MAGLAADIKMQGVSHWDVLKYIIDNLEYDQLIAEFMVRGDPAKGWVHVSFDRNRNRKENLTVTSSGTVSGICFI
jgi:hypothetical protein